jgi:hypothetical protein
MDSLDVINAQLDQIAIKYNISLSNTKKYTLDQTIQLLNKLEQSSKLQYTSDTKPQPKFTVLQDLVQKLNTELCVKESESIDHILNEIIGCIRNETVESRNFCVQQIQKIIDENYLKSNIKKKLNGLIELLIKV